MPTQLNKDFLLQLIIDNEVSIRAHADQMNKLVSSPTADAREVRYLLSESFKLLASQQWASELMATFTFGDVSASYEVTAERYRASLRQALKMHVTILSKL